MNKKEIAIMGFIKDLENVCSVDYVDWFPNYVGIAISASRSLSSGYGKWITEIDEIIIYSDGRVICDLSHRFNLGKISGLLKIHKLIDEQIFYRVDVVFDEHLKDKYETAFLEKAMELCDYLKEWDLTVYGTDDKVLQVDGIIIRTDYTYTINWERSEKHRSKIESLGFTNVLK